MGVFVFLPLVLPLTAWPVARLAEHHLHPRMATWLLTGASAVLAVCSTLSLALLMVVGTAQLPGNPLPDGWSDPEVREAVPYDEVAGRIAIPTLILVLASCARAAWRHRRVRRRAGRALDGLPATSVVARAVGKAALISRAAPSTTLAGFAVVGPVPRRVAALLGPAPAARSWPSLFTGTGLAAWGAAAGTAASALSSANSAVTLFVILKAATPL
ncbi:hypothetical protein ACFCZ2_07920 [Streptomyces sp. NPDC056202]|uniref:hypothetical protein n=1 Tax=Streptomyces sp. NPDC056202 TaxID=3345745 RepID=UPI0035D7A7D9